ncbi:kelch domain-containing protein 2 isoform X2 [Oenanthe melanoleuca]|uniref:kelch domain-containing protein 2 isoform X2 n=1 Tax=Oenanthe melanoleuca TaxID=2939378 RepID=UPI0024C194ED|nr:kelch domain-containing protein 2 isoform X2 [Oenanthe melanoleuca]
MDLQHGNWKMEEEQDRGRCSPLHVWQLCCVCGQSGLSLRGAPRPGQHQQVLHVKCQGVPPSSKDKLGVWVHKNRLIFFGGYGYFPEGKHRGTFEFDETSFWNSGHPRGWNDHVHVLDLETFTWSQPITTGKTPSPRAAHACATVGNRGFVFGGRYRESRMNDFYYLNLDTWEWNEILTQGICPVGRSWHSLTPISSDHLFLFGGFTTDKQPLSDAWIYCISKNEWVQFEHNYSEKPRLWHTACASEEGEVIIFGGCANNLLAHSKAAHSNEILVFSLQPRSLVRAAARGEGGGFIPCWRHKLPADSSPVFPGCAWRL